MKGTLEKQGRYELFETSHGHQILRLERQDWFALVETDQGHLMVLSDSDHKKKNTLHKGDFYLAVFDSDPDFQDQPHLFLQDRRQDYYEFILPNGLPTADDHQKKLIRSDKKIPAQKVKEHLQEST